MLAMSLAEKSVRYVGFGGAGMAMPEAGVTRSAAYLVDARSTLRDNKSLVFGCWHEGADEE